MMPYRSSRHGLVLLLLLSFVVCVQVAFAQDNPDDAIVAKAINAALLGDAAEIHAIAAERLARERESPDREKPTLAENIQALAVAVQRPLSNLDEKRTALAGYPRDQMTRNLDRLIRNTEPRQQFLEARKDQRYEDGRRIFNGFSGPVSSLAQGQFFPLFALPFNIVDYLLIGRRYLTPEGRRELYTARAAAAYPEPDATASAARRVLIDWTPRRRRLAALQAETNGKHAHQRGEWETADFWFRREAELRGWPRAQRSAHLDAAAQRARENARMRDSLTVTDGDSKFYSPAEFSVYTNVLRGLVLGDSDRVATWTRELLVAYPHSDATDDVEAARAGVLHLAGEDSLARAYLAEAADGQKPSPWRSRSALYLQLPVYTPAAGLEKAEKIADARFRAFLLQGEDPERMDAQVSAEEARVRRESWIYRAQGLFVTDIIGRAIALPFVLPFPKPELLDAAANLEQTWFDSPTGREWHYRVMKAQSAAHRYTDAAKSARRLGDPKRAISYDRKAARRLEDLAGQPAASPREAASIYERILNAYPAYRHAGRVEKELADARLDLETVIRIDRDELLAYPELWKDAGLHLDPQLLDGNRKNGEIASTGAALLFSPSIVYTDISTGRRIEVPIDASDQKEVLRMMESRRRLQAIRAEIAKPLPRRKVPIEIEAGVFPGFDVQPGVVPLDPNPQVRELYE